LLIERRAHRRRIRRAAFSRPPKHTELMRRPLVHAIGKNAIFRIIVAMRVDVLALDGVFDLGLSAVLDAFQTANELIDVSGLSVPRFEVRIVGLRKAVKTSQGLTVPVHAAGTRTPDCVVVPAIGFKMPGPLEAALT